LKLLLLMPLHISLMRHPLLRLILLILGFTSLPLYWACSASQETAGVASGGESSVVSGILVDSNGIPQKGIKVNLLPLYYNPYKDDPPAGSQVITNKKGEYFFNQIAQEQKLVLFARSENNTLAFKKVVEAPKNANTSQRTDTLYPASILYINQPDSLKLQPLYIPGTPILAQDTPGVLIKIPGVPSGIIQLNRHIYKAGEAPEIQILFDSLKIAPGQKILLELDLYQKISRTLPGDTLWLENGYYRLTGGLNGFKIPPNDPVIIKARTKGQVHIVAGNGLNIQNSSGLVIDGLTLSGPHLISDLVHIHANSSHIYLKNLTLHDGGRGASLMRINDASHIYIDSCTFYYPGIFTSGNGRESSLSFLRADSSAIRYSLFQGSLSRQHIRITEGSKHFLIEGNIFSEHSGSNDDPVIELGGNSPATASYRFDAQNISIRNNIFLNSQTGVCSFRNVTEVEFVYNLVLNITHKRHDWIFWGSGRQGLGSQKIILLNNIFANTLNPWPKQILGETVKITDLVHKNNAWYNAGQTLPQLGSLLPNQEQGGINLTLQSEMAEPVWEQTKTLYYHPGLNTYPEILNYFVQMFQKTQVGKKLGIPHISILETANKSVFADMLGKKRSTDAPNLGPFE